MINKEFKVTREELELLRVEFLAKPKGSESREAVLELINNVSRELNGELKEEVKEASIVESKMIVDEYGDKEWWVDGKRHREDGPAVEYVDGGKSWYRDGLLHREDGPAVEYVNGDKYWYKNGRLHREGGPALEYADGGKSWWVNGKLHREDGPAVEDANGTKEWWLDGFRGMGLC